MTNRFPMSEPGGAGLATGNDVLTALLSVASRIGHCGVWTFSVPGGELTWSQEMRAIHEVDSDFAPTPELALDFYRTEFRAPVEQAFRQCVETGRPYDLEAEILTARGTPRRVRIIGEAQRDALGGICRVQGAFRDISELQKAAVESVPLTQAQLSREALRASEKRFRTVFEQAAVGIFLSTLEGVYLQVNARMCEIVGHSEEDLLGRACVEITHEEDVVQWKRVSQEFRAGLREHHVCEKRFWGNDGRLIWGKLTMAVVLGAHADSPQLIGVLEDITERKRADAELARSNRALRMLSHCNEALIRAESEQSLLEAICQTAVELGGFPMAWVGYALDDDYKTISIEAHAGKDDGYLASLGLSWSAVTPMGQGPAGRVIRSGRAEVIADIRSEARQFVGLQKARDLGYLGLVSLPLLNEGRAFGILTLYVGEICTLHPDEIRLLHELADDMAFGITTLRSRAERRRTHEAVLAMARGISANTGAEFFEKLTRSMIEALGAQGGFLAQFEVPRSGTVRTVCAVVNGLKVANFDYPLESIPREETEGGPVCILTRRARQTAVPLPAGLEFEACAGTELLDAAGVAVGMIFVFFVQPIAQRDFVCSTLKIFATRAAAEWVRQKDDAKVREQASLLDKARDAILVCDLDYRITYWNKSAERLYGWTAEEALGQPAGELICQELDLFEEAMYRLKRLGDWTGEMTPASHGNRRLTIETRLTLVGDEREGPRSILAICTDITERKKLEQQFLRAQRMESLGTLAGGIAHDLNNILAPIVISIDLLKSRLNDEYCGELLGIMEASVKRGSAMVQQVLSFGRGVEGKRVPIEPGELIAPLLSIVRDTFPKSIELQTQVAPGVWSIEADSTQLHQVILNLCLNARDAMSQGGRLKICVYNLLADPEYLLTTPEAALGSYVVLEVSDTGEGMPPEVLEKIFEPFFTTKEFGKGTGLGLSTTLAIVKSHGGFISVRSEAHNGTVFQIGLPAEEVVSQALPVPCEPERSEGKGELILIIDDEEPVRKTTGRVLEAYGYRVLTAADGAEGVALYAQHSHEIAVVLTDMMMPIMDGPATIRVLRRINPEVKIVAASGLGSKSSEASPMEGVSHFLQKPYNPPALLQTLSSLLRTEG